MQQELFRYVIYIAIAILGLYLYSNARPCCGKEGFSSAIKPRCPDMLIQNGSKFFLFNSKLAKIPGVNPIMFENLGDYTEFLDWQRSQGIRCPVLFLQKTVDAQGNSVYKIRPSVDEPQGGLNPSTSPQQPNAEGIEYPQYDPAFIDDFINQDSTLLVDATRNDPPYNQQSYPSFDESAYYQGMTTPLDKMDKKFLKKGAISPIATHPTWGGGEYTQKLVDQGYFKENEVQIAIS